MKIKELKEAIKDLPDEMEVRKSVCDDAGWYTESVEGVVVRPVDDKGVVVSKGKDMLVV